MNVTSEPGFLEENTTMGDNFQKQFIISASAQLYTLFSQQYTTRDGNFRHIFQNDPDFDIFFSNFFSSSSNDCFENMIIYLSSRVHFEMYKVSSSYLIKVIPT